MIDVLEGSNIPLSLQVYDGNPDLKVTARLYIDGSFYFSKSLQHQELGLYIDQSVEMPACRFMVAQYLTDMPSSYEIAQDVFACIPKVQEPEIYILGEVIQTLELTEYDGLIIGEVQDADEEM